MEIVIIIVIVIAIALLLIRRGSSVEQIGSSTEQKGTFFIDPRDGKKYRTVKIGNQVWMAENLNYAAESSYCYNSDQRIYNWETAMKACPEGWHLSSDEEWQELVNFVGNEIAGKKLKARSGWAWDKRHNVSGNGTDDYGFSAMPNLFGFDDGSFLRGDRYDGTAGYWWSSTKYEADKAYIWSIFCNDALAARGGAGNEIGCLCSVRCIQDQALAQPIA